MSRHCDWLMKKIKDSKTIETVFLKTYHIHTAIIVSKSLSQILCTPPNVCRLFWKKTPLFLTLRFKDMFSTEIKSTLTIL